MIIERINLHARVVFDVPAEPIVRDIEFENMRVFIYVFGHRINIFPREWPAPFQCGFGAGSELIFVT